MSDKSTKLPFTTVVLIVFIVLTTLFSGFVSFIFYQNHEESVKAAELKQSLIDSNFVTYQDPILVGKEEVGACQEQSLIFIRNSEIFANLSSSSQLNRILDDGATYKRFDERINDRVEPGEGKAFKVSKKIPCEFEPGTYFYDGITGYTYEGVEKSIPWKSQEFTVTE
jgi:hypothetical protein